MYKEVYILKGLSTEDYNSFKDRIFKLSNSLVELHGPEALKTCLTLKPPPPISVIPFKREKIAVISVTRNTNSAIDLITKSD